MKYRQTSLAASTPLLSAGNPVFSTTEREMFVDVIFVELGPPEDPLGKPGGLWKTLISGQFSRAPGCCLLLMARHGQTTFTGKNLVQRTRQAGPQSVAESALGDSTVSQYQVLIVSALRTRHWCFPECPNTRYWYFPGCPSTRYWESPQCPSIQS